MLQNDADMSPRRIPLPIELRKVRIRIMKNNLVEKAKFLLIKFGNFCAILMLVILFIGVLFDTLSKIIEMIAMYF